MKTSNSNVNQNELTLVFSDQLRHGWRNWGWILSYATAWLSSMLSRELLRPPNDITIDCDAVLQRQQGQLSINMAARSRQIVTDQLIDSSRLLADLRHTPDSWRYLYLCRYCAQNISVPFRSMRLAIMSIKCNKKIPTAAACCVIFVLFWCGIGTLVWFGLPTVRATHNQTLVAIADERSYEWFWLLSWCHHLIALFHSHKKCWRHEILQMWRAIRVQLMR